MGTPDSTDISTAANESKTRLTSRQSRRTFLEAVGTALPVLGLLTTAESAKASGTADTTTVTYQLLAVTASGSGTVLPFTVEVAPGDGTLLVDIGRVGLQTETQSALREGVAYARRTHDQSLDGREITVSFDVPDNARLALDGKSGEAGVTLAVVAALQGQSVPLDTLVTGRVADDGSLLDVGGIRQKAAAARAFGAEELLVPPGQAVDIDGITVTSVEMMAEVINRTRPT